MLRGIVIFLVLSGCSGGIGAALSGIVGAAVPGGPTVNTMATVGKEVDQTLVAINSGSREPQSVTGETVQFVTNNEESPWVPWLIGALVVALFWKSPIQKIFDWLDDRKPKRQPYLKEK